MDVETERLPGLDLLRSIAIVWVMLFHSFVVGGLGPSWEWLSRYGWMGVDLFFVLSGFLIGVQVMRSIKEKACLSFRDFYLRRAFRILPAYWVVLALYTIWPAFREAPGMEPAWKFFAFVQNLDVNYLENSAFSHAWSLCVEEHFYLLFPVLAVWFSRCPAMWKFSTIFIILVLFGIASRSVLWLHDMAVDPEFKRNWFIEDIYYPTWNRLDGLLVGIALAAWKVFRAPEWSNARRYANLPLLAGAALVGFSFWLFRDRVGLLANSIGWPVLSIGLGSLVFAGAGRDSLIGRWKIPGIGWLAASSYSLYLIHKPVYHLVQERWGEPLAGKGFVAFLAYGAAAVATGALLHYSVERPSLRLRKRVELRFRTKDARALA